MALIIENISGALLDVNDLGFTLPIGGSQDLTTEARSLDVATSAQVGGDLNALITSGSLVVKDPNDDVTNLNVIEGIAACRAHNQPPYQLMHLTGNVAESVNGIKTFNDRVIVGSTSTLVFTESGGGTNVVGFQAPDTITTDVIWTLPNSDATITGQVLSSDAGGILSWVTMPVVNPGGVDSNVQYNNGGVFGGNNAFNFNDVTLQVDIIGNTLDTQLTVGGQAQVLTGDTNATLYVEVDGGGANDEAARFYWNRGAGASGWISYDYDGTAPNIRIADEDDDPSHILFQTIGTGTDLAPQFDNRFGTRGGISTATTGFKWTVNGTEVAIMDTGVIDITSATGEYRVNGIPLALNNLSDVDTVTTAPTTGDHLMFDGTDWVPTTILRPTFCIFAEENSAISVGTNNFEYSFGNGATNTDADPSGIPVGVNCTIIGIGISARNATSGTSTASVSITNNGTVVATGGIATGAGFNTTIRDFTTVVPGTADFVPGDTVQFLTASTTGTLADVRVVVWFERTS